MVKVVYRCGIVGLTNIKQDALDSEYHNLQTFLTDGKDNGLYSANKQQALRYFTRIKMREYPLSIRNDLLKLDIDRENAQYKFWARIPLKKIRGGCWVALKPHKPIDTSAKICESKIIKRKHGYELHLVVEKAIQFQSRYSNIISIDLGSRNAATSVEFRNGKTRFYTAKLREVRGHYFRLRKVLGQKKAFATIRKIGSTEKRIVNDICHKITLEIVRVAEATNSIIAMGILAGVRKKKVHRKAARKIATMPSHKLATMIRYKAEQRGIVVIETYEGWTSKTCSKCGSIGIRRNGLFKCRCGYQDHADRNGAINIGKRVLRYICNIGVSVNMPELNLWRGNLPLVSEATQLVGW